MKVIRETFSSSVMRDSKSATRSAIGRAGSLYGAGCSDVCPAAPETLITMPHSNDIAARHVLRNVLLTADLLKAVQSMAEKKAITQALEETGYNKVRAADLLGIHRTQLYKKMKKHGLALQPA